MIVVSRSRRIDWARVIDNLQRQGMTIRQIAAAVDVGCSTVKDYCDDRCIEPAFWTGSTLLQLWSERTGAHWMDAPIRTVQPSVSAMLKAMR